MAIDLSCFSGHELWRTAPMVRSGAPRTLIGIGCADAMDDSEVWQLPDAPTPGSASWKGSYQSRPLPGNALPITTLRERLLAEPPNTPPYVLENVGAAEPQLVVRALGTDWLATDSAWISIGWLVVLGQIMARVLPGRSSRGRTLAGLGFTGITGVSMLAHQIGTIATARSVGAPMRAVVFTATLAYNTYPEEAPLPARVHMTRALGGPAEISFSALSP